MANKFIDIWLPFIAISILCVIAAIMFLLMGSEGFLAYGMSIWILSMMIFFATWFSLMLYRRTRFAFFLKDKQASIGLILLGTVLIFTIIGTVTMDSINSKNMSNFVFTSSSFLALIFPILSLIPILQETNPYTINKPLENKKKHAFLAWYLSDTVFSRSDWFFTWHSITLLCLYRCSSECNHPCPLGQNGKAVWRLPTPHLEHATALVAHYTHVFANSHH